MVLNDSHDSLGQQGRFTDIEHLPECPVWSSTFCTRKFGIPKIWPWNFSSIWGVKLQVSLNGMARPAVQNPRRLTAVDCCVQTDLHGINRSPKPNIVVRAWGQTYRYPMVSCGKIFTYPECVGRCPESPRRIWRECFLGLFCFFGKEHLFQHNSFRSPTHNRGETWMLAQGVVACLPQGDILFLASKYSN